MTVLKILEKIEAHMHIKIFEKLFKIFTKALSGSDGKHIIMGSGQI